jgi:hypothetical protein
MSAVFKKFVLVSLCFRISTLLGAASAAGQMAPATWGNPSQPWGNRRLVTEADRALIASYRSGHEKPLMQTNFADPSELQSAWSLQSDDRSDLKSCREPQSVVATKTGLELRTLAAVKCHAKWSTGFLISKTKYSFGFFEASIKVADITGMNNAFWLVSAGAFEIDIAEVHYPNDLHITLHNWAASGGTTAVGFDSKFSGNFSAGFHDFGVLWTPTELIFEVDGQPVAAMQTNAAIAKPVDIRFSTALADFAGKVPENPVGHHMYVRSLRVYALQDAAR